MKKTNFRKMGIYQKGFFFLKFDEYVFNRESICIICLKLDIEMELYAV